MNLLLDLALVAWLIVLAIHVARTEIVLTMP